MGTPQVLFKASHQPLQQIVDEAQLFDPTNWSLSILAGPDTQHGFVRVLIGHRKVGVSTQNDLSTRSTDVTLRVPRTFTH
jgi:hypothetical protein